MPERLADQITVRLTANERAALEEIAKREHRSLAFLAREGIKVYLEAQSANGSSEKG